MDYLVSSQVKCDDDNDDDDDDDDDDDGDDDDDDDDDDNIIVTEPTNNKMNMSHVDFGQKKIEEKDNSDNYQEVQCSKLQDENEKDLCSLSITSELDSHVFPKSDQPISI